MAIDDKGLKIVEGFYFPEGDTECSGAVFNELWKLDKLPPMGRKCVVQAGGNVGVFPAKLATMFDHVFTFEPDLENYRCLRLNCGNTENIHMFNSALGAEFGRVKVVEPIDEPNNCGALQVKATEDPAGAIVLPIDELALWACDLIYLDIEGYEYYALMGAKETIAAHRPVIVLENKGISDHFEPKYPDDDPFNGNDNFRDWVCKQFNYEYVGRHMRDDIFTPCSK